MSIASEINALTQNVSALDDARSDIRTALSEKGVTADTHNFVDFADDVRSIQAGGGGGSYRLPDAYQEVEYIETTGNQYIQTNLLISSTDSVEVEVAFTNNQQQGIFCAREDTGTKTFTVFLISGKLRYDYGASQTMYSDTTTISMNQKYKIKMVGNKAYLDDVLVNTFTASTYSPVNPLNFLASYNPWGTYQNYSKQKFYGSRVKNSSGGYKGFFVACYRKSDNVGGLYDLVTQTFYPPNNAVNKGPKVNPVPETSNTVITDYDTTYGYIYGANFGTNTGTVWLLNRDTHTYSSLSVSSWNDTYIVLSSPIDRSTIQGNTCFYVKTAEDKCSTKYMVYGDGTLTVPQYGLIYVQNPDTKAVTKVTMTSQSDLNELAGGRSYLYGFDFTLNSTTYYSENVVGVQFGPSISEYSVPSYFLSSFTNLNQPVVFTSDFWIDSNVTSYGQYILAYNYSLDCPVIFPNENSGQTYQYVGDYFMCNCFNFNQPMDMSMMKNISCNSFMRGCYGFNQKLKLPTNPTVTSIGNYFLSYCYAFNQKLELPSNLTAIGTYFMYYDYGYNIEIELPSTVTSIGNYFLSYCYSFNQPLDLSNVTTLGTYLLSNSLSFNSEIKLKSTLTSMPTYFLQNCYSFNKYIDFSNIQTFGNYFLKGCYSFNQFVDCSSAKTIGTYFLSGCYAFTQTLTIPSTVKSIGNYFMQNTYSCFKLVVNNTTAPGTNSMTVNVNLCPAHERGITIYGTGRATWISKLPNKTSAPYRNLINGGS